MENQQFYDEDRIVQMMQQEGRGWLFYVSHNTPELFDEYIGYCRDNGLDPTEDASATDFMHNREQIFEESFTIDK